MLSVVYKGKIHKVFDVKIEGFEWHFHNGERMRTPDNTWFLIDMDNGFSWVHMNECKNLRCLLEEK